MPRSKALADGTQHPALVEIARGLPATAFFKALTAPYIPEPEQNIQPAPNAQPMGHQASKLITPNVPGDDPNPNPLTFPLWRSTGHWSWANDLPLTNAHMISRRYNNMVPTKTWYGVGLIGRESVQFMCKTWSLRDSLKKFVSELAFNKVQLLPLHGVHVLPIIGVYTGPDVVNVIMEPPHHQFWISPSSDIPHVLKKRCIEAYQQIHSRGVLHNNLSLENIVIGADCRVHLLDFEYAKAVEPVNSVNMEKTNKAELRRELRKVKFLLDYENSRAEEAAKVERCTFLAKWNHAEEEKARRDPRYVADILSPLEEDIVDPPLNWVTKDDHTPSRFVVPGTDVEALVSAIRKFLVNIKRLEDEGDGPPSRSPSPTVATHPSTPQRDATPVNLPETTPSEDTEPRYSLRKRKSPASDDVSPTKRLRRTAALTVQAQPVAGPSRLPANAALVAEGRQAGPTRSKAPQATKPGILKIVEDGVTHNSVKINNLNLELPAVRSQDFAYTFKLPYEENDTSSTTSSDSTDSSRSPSASGSPRPLPALVKSRSGKLVRRKVAKHWKAVLGKSVREHHFSRGKRTRDSASGDSEATERPAKRARLKSESSVEMHTKRIQFASAPDVHMVPKLQRLYTGKGRSLRLRKTVMVKQDSQPFVSRLRRASRTKRVMVIFRERPNEFEYRDFSIDGSPSPPPPSSIPRPIPFDFPFTFSFHVPLAFRNIYQWFGHNARLFA